MLNAVEKEKILMPQYNAISNCTVCITCNGSGFINKRNKKQSRQAQQDKYTPVVCAVCQSTGLQANENSIIPINNNLPHVAIVGAGIGGVALAIACMHRGIPFTLFEKDSSFLERSQGYGLTLQQASKAIRALGIDALPGGVVSTRHLVHDVHGKVIGEWGMRRYVQDVTKQNAKRHNMHIARQTLRATLLEQLTNVPIAWGHQLLQFSKQENEKIAMQFAVDNKIVNMQADILVGADGIRSVVRNALLNDAHLPLQYLGCIVILGICALQKLPNVQSSLLDGATVFQTVNGIERIYMMPYSDDAIMWQMSFPMLEVDAKILSEQGPQALKVEACKRAQWHTPIPEILAATNTTDITGYPVYDRAMMQISDFANFGNITLLGDAAHPMSPFKGQGANQALIDAVQLARSIYINCREGLQWQEKGLRALALENYEKEMLERSAVKVKASAEAAALLHSDAVLLAGDVPRGRGIG